MDSAQPADRSSDAPASDDRTAARTRIPAQGEVPGPADDPDQVEDRVVAESISSERSPKDMAISLLVLLIPIALVFGSYRIFLGADEPSVIDPAPAVAQARATNAFPVSEPVGLADGWRAVRASFRRTDDGATLRIGYISPDGGGVQVVQSNVPAERLLPTELSDRGQPQGPTELSGRSWQRYTARAGEVGLVLLEPDRTVIVVGSVPENDLRKLANSLR